MVLLLDPIPVFLTITTTVFGGLSLMTRRFTEQRHVVGFPKQGVTEGDHQRKDMVRFPVAKQENMLVAASTAYPVVPEKHVLAHLLRVGTKQVMGVTGTGTEGLLAVDRDAIRILDDDPTPPADPTRWLDVAARVVPIVEVHYRRFWLIRTG